MEYKRNKGNSKCSSNRFKHTSKPCDGGYLFGHQLNACIVGSGVGNSCTHSGKQKEKSIAIVKSMEKIHLTSDKLISSGDEMNAVVNSLKEEALNLLKELQKFKV